MAEPVPHRLGYIVSRFPKYSETFIVREMDALEALGWQIDLFAFIREREAIVQPDAARWTERLEVASGPLVALRAHAYWLRHSPVCLIGLYWLVTSRLWSARGELLRAYLAIWLGAAWARRVEQRELNHVHAHWARHPALAALVISALTGVSFSFTAHGEDVYGYPQLLDEKVKRARFVIAISHFLRMRYFAPVVTTSDREKVHVVRCGISVTEPCSHAQRHERGRPPTILSVGRLAPMKGMTHLISACAIIRSHGYQFRCRIVGDGPLRDELVEQAMAEGVSDCVEFLGAKPQENVQRELRDASLFVLPSVVAQHGSFEGVPVSIMEAMASGVPVIATRTGAIDEIVHPEETGVLVESENPDALANALMRLLDDTALAQRLSVAAQRLVRNEFDINRSSRQLDALLRRGAEPAMAQRQQPGTVCPQKGEGHDPR